MRNAAEQDAERVASLCDEFQEYLRRLGDTTDFQFTAQTYRRDGFGADPAFSGIVAELDAEVVGYLLYTFGYDADLAVKNLDIVDLYVSRECRRRGVGRALMGSAQSICRAAGAKEIWWSVYKANRPAYEFYASVGAKLIDDLDYMYLVVE